MYSMIHGTDRISFNESFREQRRSKTHHINHATMQKLPSQTSRLLLFTTYDNYLSVFMYHWHINTSTRGAVIRLERLISRQRNTLTSKSSNPNMNLRDCMHNFNNIECEQSVILDQFHIKITHFLYLTQLRSFKKKLGKVFFTKNCCESVEIFIEPTFTAQMPEWYGASVS